MTAPDRSDRDDVPANFAARILLCSVGLSPQIVTEAIYALGVQAHTQWRPTQLHLLTTTAAAPSLEMAVLAPGAALDRLAEAWRAPWVSGLRETAMVHVIQTPSGDLSDGGELARFADASVALVRDLTASTDAALHVCLAGGRKSAAAALALAVALYGRAQDHLSHVVVNDPYAAHPLFFFPTREPSPLLGRDGRMIDAQNAVVRLIDLPFPRLRAFAPAVARDYAEAIAAAQASLNRVALSIGIDSGQAVWNRIPLVLPPALMSWLAVLTDDLLRGGVGVSRVGTPARGFLCAYRRLRGDGLAQRLAERLDDPLDAEWVEEKCSRLVAAANRIDARPRGGALVARSGRRAGARYRLALDPSEVRWIGERLAV